MKESKQIIIKTPHSKECLINGRSQEYYLPSFISKTIRFETMKEEPFFWGNYAGNRISSGYGGHHHWMVMICNDPQCPFRAVIHTDLLSKMLKSYVRKNNPRNN